MSQQSLIRRVQVNPPGTASKRANSKTSMIRRLCELCVQQVELDERDAKIVRLLYQDPLRKRSFIAGELNLHRSTISQRILQLIWRNAIRSYPSPNWLYFGLRLRN